MLCGVCRVVVVDGCHRWCVFVMCVIVLWSWMGRPFGLSCGLYIRDVMLVGLMYINARMIIYRPLCSHCG